MPTSRNDGRPKKCRIKPGAPVKGVPIREHRMKQIVKKEVCRCEKCGNEAEMTITCSLPDKQDDEKTPPEAEAAGKTGPKKQVKATAVCSHCGNEADMWIEM